MPSSACRPATGPPGARPALLLLLLPLVSLLAACGLAGCGRGSGHLTASVERLDFGLVEHGRDVEQRFRVRNGGARTVVLSAVAPSCKCLSVDPGFQRTLGPDEETEIAVRLSTANFPAQKLQGKYVQVVSDDPALPALLIPVLGEIETRITLTPALVRVGADDSAGRGEPRRLRLRTAHGYVATLTSVEILRPDWFELTRDEKAQDGLDYLLTVKPDAQRRGPVDTFVRFHVTVAGRGLPPEVYDDLRVMIQGTW